MEPKNISNRKKHNKSKNILKKIRSDYILRKINDYLQTKKSLELFNYNKKSQKRINIGLNDYKKGSELFSSIKIELIPFNNIFGKFINIKEKEKEYYHIYINGRKKETKKNYLIKNDRAFIIKIIIDYHVISLENLKRIKSF